MSCATLCVKVGDMYSIKGRIQVSGLPVAVRECFNKTFPILELQCGFGKDFMSFMPLITQMLSFLDHCGYKVTSNSSHYDSAAKATFLTWTLLKKEQVVNATTGAGVPQGWATF